MDKKPIVAYLIAPPAKGDNQFTSQSLSAQEARVQAYLEETGEHELIKTFIERGDNRRNRSKWTELEKAVHHCFEAQAQLVISEIRNLTHNEAFAKQMLRLIQNPKNEGTVLEGQKFLGRFHCCDQPFINQENLIALVEHAREQRKLHGRLIKDGLNRTTAKSGNPNASKVISRVNRPKIDNAIIYALLLQPIISEYKQRRYSQRKMVSMLNEEGFSAPEGGQWVLSQFQKVLDRIKLNEAALSLESTLKECQAQNMTHEGIAQLLDQRNVPCPKGSTWTSTLVEKVILRLAQIYEAVEFNELVVDLLPILEKYHIDEFNEESFSLELRQTGINLPEHLFTAGESGS